MVKVSRFGENAWFVSWSYYPDGTSDVWDEEESFKIADPMLEFCVNYFSHDSPYVEMEINFIGADDDCPLKIYGVLNGEVHKMKLEGKNRWHSKWDSSDVLDPIYAQLFIEFPLKKNDLGRRMSNLLENERNADVTFNVKGQEIRAHKAIVSTASSVMEAMFAAKNFREGTSGFVEINDVDPEVFRQLLRFIYTGKARRLQEDLTIVEPLFIAADKYLIQDLKQICEGNLIAQLTQKQVIHFLVLAHLHSAPKLLEESLKYLVEHHVQVRQGPEWRELLNNYKDIYFMASEKIICSQMSKANSVNKKEKSQKRPRESSDENSYEDSADDEPVP